MSLNERLIGAGAVACTADTTDVFGDGSGVALYTMDYDASDAGGLYDGTPINVEFGVEGQINYGAGFNGSSSYIILPAGVRQNNNFTASLWFNTNTITAAINLIAFRNGKKFQVQLNGGVGDGGIRVNAGNNISVNSASGIVAVNNWNHLAVVQSSTTGVTVYLNKSIVASNSGATGDLVNVTGIDSIGSYEGTFNFMDGEIDQVRIFSKALNQTEVDTLYAETACVYTCTTDTVDYPTTNVAYYKLDNSAEDETGNYDGTATNINYTFGRFGQAAVFNGSTSSILLPNTMFNTAGVLSVSVWLKTTETNGYGFVLANRYGTHTFFVELYPNGTLQAGNWQGGGLNISTTSTVNDGNWHHYVYVNNSGAISVYIDGVLENTGTQTFLNQSFTNGNQIGNYDINNSETFDGSIDQVRIFSSALTSTQVTELYEEYECEDTSTFNPVLYTGNGSTQYISNVGFEPDFVWIKNRSSSNQNVVLFDSVRGVQRELRSDSTAVEQNRNGTIYSLKSFDDNGFTVGDNTAGNYNVNGAVGGLYSGNAEFVAWCWKAGGLAVTNTDGTITSQVSANTAAGFSVVTYVGSVSQTGTVGHGLDIAPNVIIVKNRDNLYNWVCYFSELGASDFLVLNENYASSSSDSRPWNDTAPTSSVFTASNGNFIPVNQNGSDFVAYCFHSVAGYSKMGSYSGTGSAGNFVSTSVDGDAGFEPAFVMIKRSNGTADWFIYDNKRASNLYLSPNLSNAEGTDGGIVFNSNGFTINVTYSDHNTIGGEYIYMAFA